MVSRAGRWPAAMAALAVLAIGGLIAGCAASTATPTAPATPQPQATATPVTPGASPTATPARDLEAYFGGKTVTIVVGFTPGGGYDVFARIAAQYIPRYLPGSPRFLIQNRPGAGGELGLRDALRATPDGYTIGVLHPRFAFRELVGVDVPDFDLDTLVVIGTHSYTEGQNSWWIRREVASSWEGVLQLGRDVRDGQTAPGSVSATELLSLAGAPIRVIFGYGGGTEIMAAVDRGELDGTTRGTQEFVPSLYPEWIERQYIVPMFWWGGTPPDEDWLRTMNATMPAHVYDVWDIPQEQKTAWEAARAVFAFSRALVLPPGTPDDITQAYVQAYDEAFDDPAYRQAMLAAGFADLGIAHGSDLREQTDRVRQLSAEGLEIFKRLIGEQ